MSPFQYGVDFGLIGGIQAMVGFLKAGYLFSTSVVENTHAVRSLAMSTQTPQSATTSRRAANSSSLPS